MLAVADQHWQASLYPRPVRLAAIRNVLRIDDFYPQLFQWLHAGVNHVLVTARRDARVGPSSIVTDPAHPSMYAYGYGVTHLRHVSFHSHPITSSDVCTEIVILTAHHSVESLNAAKKLDVPTCKKFINSSNNRRFRYY